jgi:hypothetical protein
MKLTEKLYPFNLEKKIILNYAGVIALNRGEIKLVVVV